MHNFSNGVCKKCGCSESSVAHFGWSCRGSASAGLEGENVEDVDTKPSVKSPLSLLIDMTIEEIQKGELGPRLWIIIFAFSLPFAAFLIACDTYKSLHDFIIHVCAILFIYGFMRSPVVKTVANAAKNALTSDKWY
ncbi:MAG: hypothetical protein NT013_29105 [Planctomycetia bacterium]|nr:hypothetical protein [Planctomycetia bacterium]